MTKTILFVALICATACTSVKEKDTYTVDMPVIQNLDEVSGDLKKMQHSLVRIRVNKENTSSFGTGFFFRTRDMLVTTHHIFENEHPCLMTGTCTVSLGFAKNSKDVEEKEFNVEVALKYPDKDLIFLKVKNADQLAQDIVPIINKAKGHNGPLTVVGFFQDSPAITFSKGRTLHADGKNILTSIIVSSGFSGSPVVNSSGELVGIVSSYRPLKNQKIGFAQFINEDVSAY